MVCLCMMVMTVLTGCVPHSWHAPDGSRSFFYFTNETDATCTIHMLVQDKIKWAKPDREDVCPGGETIWLIEDTYIGNYTPEKFFKEFVVVNAEGDTLYGSKPAMNDDWVLKTVNDDHGDGCITKTNYYTFILKGYSNNSPSNMTNK